MVSSRIPRNGAAGVRVALYLRMSTAKQEDSPERQLAQLLPHVQAKGYAVVGDPYLDPGIAGPPSAGS